MIAIAVNKQSKSYKVQRELWVGQRGRRRKAKTVEQMFAEYADDLRARRCADRTASDMFAQIDRHPAESKQIPICEITGKKAILQWRTIFDFGAPVWYVPRACLETAQTSFPSPLCGGNVKGSR